MSVVNLFDDKIPSYLHCALDNLIEGMQILSNDLTYLYINDTAEKHGRTNKKQLIGRNFLDVWPNSEGTYLYISLKKCIAERISLNFENEFKFPDGSSGYFDLRIMPIPQGILILSLDVTDARKNVVALRENEERYRLVSENAEDWIYLLAPDSTAKFVSTSCHRITGYMPEEFFRFSQKLNEIVHPNDRHILEGHKQKIDQEVDKDNLEFRIIRKDGEIRWISHNCSNIYSEKGVYLGRRGTNRDITEKKKAAEALENRNNLLSGLINSFSETIIFSLDKNYCYTAFNELHRVTMEKVWDAKIQVGTSILECMTMPELRSKAKESIDRAFRGEAFVEEQYQPEIDTYYELSWNPIYKHGQILGVTGLIRDVTEKKKIHTALVAAKELAELSKNQAVNLLLKLNESQKIAKIGSWEWNISPDKVWWSDELYSIFGVSPDEYVPTAERNAAFVHPDDNLPYHQEVERVIRERKELNYDLRIITAQGELKYCNSSAKLKLDQDGNPIMMVGTFSDITERKLNEEAIIQTKTKLQTALASMTDAVFISDENGNFIEFNNAFATFHKFKDKSECARTFAEYPGILEVFFTDGKKAPVEQWAVPRALRGEVVQNAEYLLRRLDTGETWVGSYSFSPLKDKNGKIIGSVVAARDITNQKKSEEALRLSESRFRKIYDEGPFGITLINRDFKFIMANRKLCEILGYPEEELIGKTFIEISHPADLSTDLPNAKKLVNREIGVYKTEKRYLKKNGDIIWCSLTATSNYDDQGQFLHNLAIIEDITSSKTVRETLVKVGERLELATRAAHIGIWDWDLISNSLVWDDQMFKLYGVEKDEFTAAYDAWLGGIHPDDRESADQVCQQSLYGQKLYDTEFRVVWPNKEVHWLKAVGQVFHKADGTPERMIGVNYDITNSKMAAEAIKESESKFRLLLEKIPIPLVYVSLNGEFIYRNERFVKVFGYSQKEVTTINDWWKLAYPNAEYRKSLIKKWARVLKQAIRKNTDIEPDEYYVFCKDGITRTCIISGILINNNVLVTLVDITDRKQAEQEIVKLNEHLEQRVEERTQQLTAVNKELEAFSYSVSHDLRAPLRGINGFTKILLEDYAPSLDEEGKRVCNIIEENSQKMGQLIDNLLSFSRLNRIEFNMGLIQMERLILGAYNEVTDESQKGKIELTLGPVLNITGDSVMLKQVWVNLLSNAVKYSSKAEKPRIDVKSWHENEHVVYCVSDNGVGFEMAYLNKLFGVFQRLHSAKDFEGTGVGLAIVQRIVLRHNGKVWAEGTPGKGASFYFSLPVYQF